MHNSDFDPDIIMAQAKDFWIANQARPNTEVFEFLGRAINVLSAQSLLMTDEQAAILYSLQEDAVLLNLQTVGSEQHAANLADCYRLSNFETLDKLANTSQQYRYNLGRTDETEKADILWLSDIIKKAQITSWIGLKMIYCILTHIADGRGAKQQTLFNEHEKDFGISENRSVIVAMRLQRRSAATMAAIAINELLDEGTAVKRDFEQVTNYLANAFN